MDTYALYRLLAHHWKEDIPTQYSSNLPHSWRSDPISRAGTLLHRYRTVPFDGAWCRHRSQPRSLSWRKRARCRSVHRLLEGQLFWLLRESWGEQRGRVGELEQLLFSARPEGTWRKEDERGRGRTFFQGVWQIEHFLYINSVRILRFFSYTNNRLDLFSQLRHHVLMLHQQPHRPRQETCSGISPRKEHVQKRISQYLRLLRLLHQGSQEPIIRFCPRSRRGILWVVHRKRLLDFTINPLVHHRICIAKRLGVQQPMQRS